MRIPPAPLALLILLAACSRSDVDRPTPTARQPSASAAPSPSPSPTTTPVPTRPSPSPPRPEAIEIPGLPEQGVAVERGGDVVLYDTHGKVVETLSGFEIYSRTDVPGTLVLQRGETYFELVQFERVLRPLPSRARADRLQPPEPPSPHLPRPMFRGRPALGHWRYSLNDPRSYDRVLAQWSGECEAPAAFFVDKDEREVEPVTGEKSLVGLPESIALGWTKHGQAVVYLPEGVCGGTHRPPGVFLFRDPGDGRLLVRTPHRTGVRMWGTAIAD